MSSSNEEQLIDQLSIPKNRISPSELIKYYNQHNIEFPRNKDGNPNMKYSQNKKTYKLLTKRKISQVIEDHLRVNNKKNKYQSTQDCLLGKKEIEECIICYEPLDKDLVILECQHKYCFKCSIKYFRTKDTCPLCQKKVIDLEPQVNIVSADSTEDISESQLIDIVQEEIEYLISEQENKTLIEKMYIYLIGFLKGEEHLIRLNQIEIEKLSENIILKVFERYQ